MELEEEADGGQGSQVRIAMGAHPGGQGRGEVREGRGERGEGQAAAYQSNTTAPI
jgi:hypothetical protein